MRCSWIFAAIVAAIVAADVGGLLPEATAEEPIRFPFVIPGFDATPSATNFSALNSGPAGDDGFVRVRDGHFATDSRRLRIWGVNFSFGANFPSHEDAERVAAHLSKIGVNGVRIHHHESQASPAGMFAANGDWDPDQIDRLDYFCDQLNKNGIYVNLNLHVGRSVSQRLGLPGFGNNHAINGDKHGLQFHAQIQTEFWKYCRELLGHVNPYRGLRRADDPGIAMLEIANENKFSNFGSGALLSAPKPHRGELQRKWNAWLLESYGSTAAAKKALNASVPGKPVTLVDGGDWSQPDLGVWRLNDNDGKCPVESTVKNEGQVLELAPQTKPVQAWHQQFGCYGLDLRKETPYVLRFDVRADRGRPLVVNAASNLGGWKSLGLSEEIEVTGEWKTYEFGFVPLESIQKTGMVTFDLGGSTQVLQFRNMSLVEGGGETAISTDQSLEDGTVPTPGRNSSPVVQAAFRKFMYDTEVDFYTQTKKLLRDLGVKVPITTTQMNYHPPSIAAQVADYGDMHAYWHHPIFPGKGWDPENWLVQNESLVAYPFHNKWPRCNMLMRTCWRLWGKPFTFSEWNTGEPGFFSADAIPIAAILASLQDWDAVFFYDYHSSPAEWDRDRFDGFFSLNGQPTKIALLSALANLYRRADLTPLTEPALVAEHEQGNLGALGITHLVGTKPDLPIEQSHALPTDQELTRKESKLLKSPDGAVIWDARELERAHVVVETEKSIVLWGFVGQQTFDVGPLRVEFGPCERDYAVFVATSTDNLPLSKSRSILVTVLGNAENHGMGWNADRTSVGRQWGVGPTMALGIPLKMTLKGKPLRAYSLDGTGKRKETIDSFQNSFSLGPQHRTLWYELIREDDEAKIRAGS